MRVSLASEIDFEGWRAAARRLRAAEVPPDAVTWTVGQDLFATEPPGGGEAAFGVPRGFLDLAADVIRHRDPARFALLYRLLWRFRDQPNLPHILTDPDVARARNMAKAVGLASHKMKAFVRFREVADLDGVTYVAWFEPAHRVLERTAGFFVGRFANMRFSILTPDACAHWDGSAMTFTPGADKGQAPSEDALEDVWRTYYASIFNPARLKVKAMQAEMPKRYWRNLPEAVLIPELIEQAEGRHQAMVRAEPVETRRRVRAASPRTPPPEGAVPADLSELAAMVQACRRCDLWRCATQGVPGEGPSAAPLMLVGEQPGDMEDLAGKPLVGPAGKVLDRALAEAGVPRAEVFVTNAVKHFKHELRGKRRLHKTPDGEEVAACRWWQEHERRLVRPRLVLALGGTAALSVLGRAVPIGKSRGQVFQLEDQGQAMVTVHPSYLLRIPDEAAKAAAYGRFVEDLTQAHRRATLGA